MQRKSLWSLVLLPAVTAFHRLRLDDSPVTSDEDRSSLRRRSGRESFDSAQDREPVERPVEQQMSGFGSSSEQRALRQFIYAEGSVWREMP